MVPLKVDYKDVAPSEALSSLIAEQCERLEKYFDRITSCHVVVGHPHKNHKHGNTFHINIVLNLPGQEIVVSREPEKNLAHEDAYIAVRDAFKTVKRQLQEYAQKFKDELRTSQRNREAGRTLDIKGTIEV